MKFLKPKTVLLLVIGSLFSLFTTYALSSDPTPKTLHTHHQVKITGFEFVPKELVIAPGDTVTWTNEDVVPHNVINSADKKAISPDLAAGESYSYTVPEVLAGDVQYFCGFHPSMLGSLTQ